MWHSVFRTSGLVWAAGFTFGLTLVLLVAGAACGGDVDREAYIAANDAVLAEVPVFVGARQVKRSDLPYEGVVPPIWFRGPDIDGYDTVVSYQLDASPAEVLRFFRQAMLADGWELVSMQQERLRFVKGQAGVDLLVGEFSTIVSERPPGELGYTLEVDHNEYRRGKPTPLPFEATAIAGAATAEAAGPR